MCYTELGCYTNRSVGLYSAKEILEYIEEMFWPDGGMGIEAICIMDYYSVQSFPSIKKHLEERNMCYIPKILFGVEIDVTHCAREYRTKCIAKTQNGIDKLYEIVSFANGKALTIEELSQFHEGIFIGLEDGCNDVDIAAAADFWYVTPDRSDVDILRMVRDVKTTGNDRVYTSTWSILSIKSMIITG